MTYLRQFAGLVLAAASGKDPETAAPKTRKATAA
jgi:hypothetical protein